MIKKFTGITDILCNLPTDNATIADNMVKAFSRISNYPSGSICASISGGSDSDVMLDILYRCDPENKIRYIWLDTGLEYESTKEQLSMLEHKYGISIERIKAAKSIPATCRDHGQPFLSKYVSEALSALQRVGFSFTDEPYEALVERYPTVSSYLRWWCNQGNMKCWCISYNKGLKEFLIANPPTFRIGNKCCYYAKKLPQKQLIKSSSLRLKCVGIRRAEGGIRGSVYKSCFDSEGNVDNYRPLFWYTNQDKIDYERAFGVTHSRCYTEMGMKRTGCAGCPYNRQLFEDLDTIRIFEPKLYKAVTNVFGDSYSYTEKYRTYMSRF